MNKYIKFKNVSGDFPGNPCDMYAVVDVIFHDGSEVNKRAKDVIWNDMAVSEWRLAENQEGPRKEIPQLYTSGSFVDSTALSIAQDYGLDDRSFEFY